MSTTRLSLPIWLDAQNELHTALLALPADYPRPESLISPKSDSEMGAWNKLEASRRARLADAVLTWLSHAKWPEVLDGTDEYLLSLRISAARDWLDLGSVGVVFAEETGMLMSRLLVDGWSECFLEHHRRELAYRIAQYHSGRSTTGGFAE